MTGQEVLRGATALITAIVAFSCNHSNPEISIPTNEPINIGTKKNADSKILSTYHEDWIEMRTKSDKLVFKRYFLDPNSNLHRDLNKMTWMDSTVDAQKISEFNLLLDDVPNQGYCCCPVSNYSISFYKDQKEIGVYFIDTISTVAKAMFFDDDYQTSYSIDLEDWNAFISDN
jgi:hypothetical protein